jgi:hypothetical protein
LIDDSAVSEWIVNNVILKTILEKQDTERIKTKLYGHKSSEKTIDNNSELNEDPP